MKMPTGRPMAAIDIALPRLRKNPRAGGRRREAGPARAGGAAEKPPRDSGADEARRLCPAESRVADAEILAHRPDEQAEVDAAHGVRHHGDGCAAEDERPAVIESPAPGP